MSTLSTRRASVPSCGPVAQSYIDGVLSGKIITGELVRLSVQRHVDDLESAESRNLRFNHLDDGKRGLTPAKYATSFVECLPLTTAEWAGQQFILQPWQAFIVEMLFGWYKLNSEDQWVRRYNTAFVTLARKNGKSTLGAAIGHMLFIGDHEPAAQVYTAATKFKQAKIVHEEAKRMVRQSPTLKKLVTILRDNLSVASTDSKYEPLGKDAGITDDGLNVSGAIIDEIHAHPNRELYDVLDTATGSRRNPLLFLITTAGVAGDITSIYSELKQYTKRVMRGIVEDDSWFGYVATLDKNDEWDDESVWLKPNPNLGISVKIDDLRDKAKYAKATPSAINNFRRKHMNEDVEDHTTWVSDVAWKKGNGGDFYDADAPLGISEDTIQRFQGQRCFVGGDLSSVNDLTSLVFAFPGEDGSVDAITFAWCPRANALGRTREKRVPYAAWADEGQLILTQGDSIDTDELRALLRKARDEWKWDIVRIAFDPHNARTLITQLVNDDDFAEDEIIEHMQTCGHMAEPICITQKLLLDGNLRHGGHKPLRWCVSNVIVYADTGGRERFDKRKSREKIDCAVALVMAVGLAVDSGEEVSFYENNEVEF